MKGSWRQLAAAGGSWRQLAAAGSSAPARGEQNTILSSVSRLVWVLHIGTTLSYLTCKTCLAICFCVCPGCFRGFFFGRFIRCFITSTRTFQIYRLGLAAATSTLNRWYSRGASAGDLGTQAKAQSEMLGVRSVGVALNLKPDPYIQRASLKP